MNLSGLEGLSKDERGFGDRILRISNRVAIAKADQEDGIAESVPTSAMRMS
jgi:hypothetical protein